MYYHLHCNGEKASLKVRRQSFRVPLNKSHDSLYAIYSAIP